jgi:hypothetical protein
LLEPGLNLSRSAFQEHNLIFVPGRGSSSKFLWAKSRECPWSASGCLKKRFKVLRSHYDTCSLFFRDRLRIGHATLSSLVDEILCVCKPQHQPSKSVLLELPRYLDIDKKWSCFGFHYDDTSRLWRLQDVACTPVRYGNRDLSRLSCSGEFFLGDQQSYVEAFKSSVPLIDFTVDQVRYLSPVFEGLEIREKSLRACVKATGNPLELLL